EVIGKTESGDSGAFASPLQQITAEEMLRMPVEQTGPDKKTVALDFDSEHLFRVPLIQNGRGHLLEALVHADGTPRSMFELTPVVESGEDPEDVTCAEVAVPTTAFIKTEDVDFNSLEIYGSGEKIETE